MRFSGLVAAGTRCEAMMASRIQNVSVTDVQADECWGFIRKKEAHKGPSEAQDNTIGDCYTWLAIERNSKLVLAFSVGRRTLANAMDLMRKLRSATAPDQKFQLTTDGLDSYIAAVDEMLGDRVHYAQLIKIYSAPQENERRYSPPEMVCAVPNRVN